MRVIKYQNIKQHLLYTIISAGCALGLIGCDRLEENLPECEHGLRLRFTYTWNMEFANAFPSQVDCLTLYVYDSDNRLVTTQTETSGILADEDYRMTLDLPDGEYTLVAYGGMACEESSFHHPENPSVGSLLNNLETELDDKWVTSPQGSRLHNLFYGRQDVEVTSVENHYVEATVDMMRDTNNLRIMLQHVDGTPVDEKNFNFYVKDNNTLMGWDNSLLPSQTITYCPWTRGNYSVGVNPGSEDDVVMAFAEFSLCRLVEDKESQLLITTADGERNVVNLPLINYLAATKSSQYSKMSTQEFLDRQHDWNMTFFLDDNLRWIYVKIEVLNWVVRINNYDL